MDKFTAMQAFIRVVEAGNFSKAADTLEMPKPTVTRLIQSLESQLQTKLLNRTTRRVTVTQDGAAYYERALRVLNDIEELESGMSHAKANPRGRLRIDVSASLGCLVLIPALPDFHARYPDIQIDLGVTDRPVDLIGENIDCVLRAGVISDQSLVARRVAEVYYINAASPDYLKRHGRPQHPNDLERGNGHRVVGYFSARTGRMTTMDYVKGDERLEIDGHTLVAVNDSNAYVAAAVAGMGVLQAPSFMLQEHLNRGELEIVLADWCSDPIPLHVVYPPNRHLSAKLRVFVDWVAELFAKHDLLQRCSSLPAEHARIPGAGFTRDAAGARSATWSPAPAQSPPESPLRPQASAV
ncbi:LysR substrate-binding domain-containing protein [Aquabacterium sp.]|uniref:LysR substrate-binding domain-containing protein n=1 Tax=Aquabacterium sp. TaxID=1872578 RepID=UPI002B5DC2C5|nr:LysR substrate-binding domain-containing protein [Aquabacterium sp.]HSW05062.1 LysR substrate-binding domain-containing protein [Aquabacterium sp.]